MASPASTAFRAELLAQIEILEPQIRGFRDMANDPFSSETLEFLNRELTDHVRRRDLCLANLTALDALEADGWPDMPKAEVPGNVFAELQGEKNDIAAALSEFEVLPMASKIAVGLGDPMAKPADANS
jgi:hypothetical protein